MKSYKCLRKLSCQQGEVAGSVTIKIHILPQKHKGKGTHTIETA